MKNLHLAFHSGLAMPGVVLFQQCRGDVDGSFAEVTECEVCGE